MRNVSHKICREYQNTRILFNNIFANLAVYEIMWNTMVQPGRPQKTV